MSWADQQTGSMFDAFSHAYGLVPSEDDRIFQSFPVIFLVSRENQTETGSSRTASATIRSQYDPTTWIAAPTSDMDDNPWTEGAIAGSSVSDLWIRIRSAEW